MLENRFCWTPKSVLPLKGRLDARKGLAAANTYVEKTRQRMAVLTAQEIMAVEKALQKTRQDASSRLAERNRTLERLAALPPVREEDSAAAIRANRRDADERNCLRAALVSCEEALLADNETLINTQTLLSERIVHLQAMVQERISLYVMGIRSSRQMKTFVCPLPEEGEASSLSACLAGHQALDDEVRRVAEELMLKKEAA